MEQYINVLKEIGKLQSDYNSLKLNRKLTKKAMCDLVIPFRDKYYLTDKEALMFARNEIKINEMVKIFENAFKRVDVKNKLK